MLQIFLNLFERSFILKKRFSCVFVQVGTRFPSVLRIRITFPFDKEVTSACGSFVTKDPFDFVFFVLINDVRRWSKIIGDGIWMQGIVDPSRAEKRYVEDRVDLPGKGKFEFISDGGDFLNDLERSGPLNVKLLGGTTSMKVFGTKPNEISFIIS